MQTTRSNRLATTLLCLIFASSAQAQDENVLFFFDAGQLAAEEVNSEELKAASQFHGSGSESILTLGFRGNAPAASAKKVTLPSGETALRLKPDLTEDKSSASGANITLLDPALGAKLDASRPLHLEVKFQRSYGTIHLGVQNLFLHSGEYIHAALGGISGYIEPEGTYSAYSTCYTTPNDEVRGPQLPAEETVTVEYEIEETSEGLTVKTGLLVGEEMIFDTHAEPATLDKARLNEFNRISLNLTSVPKSTGEEFIDLISVKIWQ